MSALAETVSVVIADHQPVVLDGLEAVFEAEPGIRLIARCLDGGSAFNEIIARQADLAIIEMDMPGDDGLSVCRRLRDAGSNCRVILFAGSVDEDRAMDAIRLGAGGILLKQLPSGLILECIRKVARGELWLERETTARVLNRVAGSAREPVSEVSTLTPRELQLVRLAGTGLRNSEIARRLEIREGTVKIHLHNIYRKLGLRGRVQLALYARSHGLA